MKLANTLKVSLLSSAMLLGSAQADTLYGIYMGAHGWDTSTSGTFGPEGTNLSSDQVTYGYEDDTATSFYIAFEHGIPLIPNFKFRHNDITVKGSVEAAEGLGLPLPIDAPLASTDADFTHSDFIVYYEILDNDLISVDAGINVKYIEGEFDVIANEAYNDPGNKIRWNKSYDGPAPLLYLAGEVGLPFTGLSVFGDFQYMTYDGHDISDIQAGALYTFVDMIAFDMSVEAGYRLFSFEIDDYDNIDADIEVDGIFAGVQVHF